MRKAWFCLLTRGKGVLYSWHGAWCIVGAPKGNREWLLVTCSHPRIPGKTYTLLGMLTPKQLNPGGPSRLATAQMPVHTTESSSENGPSATTRMNFHNITLSGKSKFQITTCMQDTLFIKFKNNYLNTII